MRYSSIDLLRTFALFVMVFVHFGENLSGYTIPLTGMGAPLFAFLSGASYFLWAKGQQARGKSEEEITKVSVRRGLFVFGVGFAFNILVWLPEDAFNWDVLTFIGTALLLLNVARKAPLPISVLVAVLTIMVSPLLREMADYHSYWENGYFDPDLTLSDVLIGFFATGYFPIFPWIAFSFSGFVAASLLFAEPEEESDSEESSDPRPAIWPFVLFGSGLMLTSAVLLGIRPYLPADIARVLLGGWRMFPPSTEYIFGTLGLALVLLGLLHRLIDCNPNADRFRGTLEIAKTFSRNAFTIYIVHHIVHLYPLWIYSLVQGYESTEFWTKAMPATTSLPLALLFLACCYFTLRWLGPERNYGIESWMRWLCD